MVDRLEMAKQYVQEMLEKRDDIVAAIVGGSVARGDATESSDIDLGLIVAGHEGNEYQRNGVDAWRNGVYIEACLLPIEKYADAEKVLSDRFAATHMHDALILHDSSGVLAGVQQAVRAVFMEPKYMAMRVRPVLRSLQEAVTGLREAVAAGEPHRICHSSDQIRTGLTSAVLLLRGITPSSTRGLTLLESVCPDLKARICDWQGSTGLEADKLQALLRISVECESLAEGRYPAWWGDLPRYFAEKAKLQAAAGQYHDALHLIWGWIGVLDTLAGINSDPNMESDARRLAQDLCHAVGWEGQDVLQEKVRMAEEMVAEVEAMAAHLPVPEPAAEGHDG